MSHITHYEKIREEYQRVLFFKFSYKYNPPYAIKQEPKEQEQGSVTYPMEICNTFISSNFVNFITGSKLQTGGLGEKEALFFLERDFSGERIRTYLLNKLLAYLCLDELRSMNGKIEKRIGDIEFFNTRVYTQDLPTRPRLLRLNQDENASIKALYEEYKDKESDGIEAIDAYNSCMEYLDDISKGIFNTNAVDNHSNILKHRNFLKALDLIGQNNIKALYVGVNEKQESNNKPNAKNKGYFAKEAKAEHNTKNSKTQQEKRPKLVGRLATTIIMKNGLYLG